MLYPTELLRHKNKSFRERLFRAESQHAIYLYYCIESKKSIPNAVKKVKCSCAKLKNHILASAPGKCYDTIIYMGLMRGNMKPIYFPKEGAYL